ncbi:MAG: nitrogen fixation protein NifQ [Thiobacillus sp.]|nr:nitrogen fixation protein NifQ [Thiobacillus sp.]
MPSPVADRTGLYGLLMARAGGLPNDDLFARMLVSQTVGMGAFSPGLGLAPAEFAALMARHFPGFALSADLAVPAAEAARHAERDELLTLLREHCAGADDSERWMAEIVTAACMGGDHLWQDLGLWSRVDLSRLMTQNFPALAARNTRDMKWKKFLYKQLCEREGVVVCHSPSCEVCVDYAKCFGPEE